MHSGTVRSLVRIAWIWRAHELICYARWPRRDLGDPRVLFASDCGRNAKRDSGDESCQIRFLPGPRDRGAIEFDLQSVLQRRLAGAAPRRLGRSGRLALGLGGPLSLKGPL